MARQPQITMATMQIIAEIHSMESQPLNGQMLDKMCLFLTVCFGVGLSSPLLLVLIAMGCVGLLILIPSGRRAAPAAAAAGRSVLLIGAVKAAAATVMTSTTRTCMPLTCGNQRGLRLPGDDAVSLPSWYTADVQACPIYRRTEATEHMKSHPKDVECLDLGMKKV